MRRASTSAERTEPAPGGFVLVVDDDPVAATLVKDLLEPAGYAVLSASSGRQALEFLKAHAEPPDVVLLDVQMPGMDGLEMLKLLKADAELRLIPVLMVTGDEEQEVRALELGASDYIAKPFRTSKLRAKVQSHVRMSRAVRELERMEDILMAIANAAEARSAYTEAHTRRVALLSGAIARNMNIVDPGGLRGLRLGGHLHDIGKIAVPDAILLKPGPLDEEEWRIMRRHPMKGAEILSPLHGLKNVRPVVLHHQERWDGSGYPHGLQGEAIPLTARIVSVADMYDAMTTERPYREAITADDALSTIQNEAGRLLDPSVVDAFLRVV